MYFKDLIINKYDNKELMIFVDMDGVIADYEFKKKLDFKNKRPLKTNINILEEISKLKNVELFVLSICKENYQINEKKDWLDKYAPFFIENNRIVISKESNPNMSSKELKYEILKEIIKKSNKKIIVIDDDNEILMYLASKLDKIDLYQDSSIID